MSAAPRPGDVLDIIRRHSERLRKLELMRFTSTSAAAASSRVVLNVKDYGAVGDGVTDDTTAIQYVLDLAGPLRATVFIPWSVTSYMFSNLKMYAQTQLVGAGMDHSVLQRLPGSVGTALRERSAAEGNPSGATGLWIRDLQIDGQGTAGDGIDLGNQVPAAELNFCSGVENVHVREFPTGTGITIRQNAASCKYLWSNLNSVGIKTFGGAGSYFGVWAEGNTSYDVDIAGSDDSYFHIHCEAGGAKADPNIRVDGFQNRFYGVDLALGGNRNQLITIKTGSSRHSFYNVFAATNGFTFNYLIAVPATGFGIASPTYMAALFVMDENGAAPSIFYDISSNTSLRVDATNIARLAALGAVAATAYGRSLLAAADAAALRALSGAEATANKDQPNGYAGLDAGGLLPASRLPSSAQEFKGAWNASTNTPALADGAGNAGDTYRVTAAAVRNLGSGAIDFQIGDAVLYDGATWFKLDNTDAVTSVAGRTGAVALTSADLSDVTAYIRTLLDDATAAGARGTLGLGALAVLNSVTAAEIDADAVGSSEIAPNAVGASEIGSLPAVRAYHSFAVTYPSGKTCAVQLNSERWDTDNQFSNAAVNLTGTVSKTSGSAAVVGVGTAFTTELAVGQVITIPGGASESKFVQSITDDTHLTVASNFANTAGGQTATRAASRIVCVTPGIYMFGGGVRWAANAVGIRQLSLRLNGTTTISPLIGPTAASTQANLGVSALPANPYKLAVGDYVEMIVFQDSGGDLDISSVGNYSPEFSATWLGDG